MAGFRTRLAAAAPTSRTAAILSSVAEWLRPPRQLRTTTLGKIVIGFTIAVGVAATNTGNNLLYLVLGGLFGLIAASGVLSERVLKRLAIELHIPDFLVVHHAGVVTATLSSLKTVDSFLLWIDLLDIEEKPVARTFVRELRAGSRRQIAFEITAEQRGPLRLAGVRIRTRFPFHMYEKGLRLLAPVTLWIAPDPLPARLPTVRPAGAGERPHPTAAAGDVEFRGLRDRIPSDPQTRVHWKRSATVGQHVVKQFSAERNVEVMLRLRAGPDAAAFEAGLRTAAGLLDAARRSALPVRFDLGGNAVEAYDSARGWRKGMRLLAEADRDRLPPGAYVVEVALAG